MKHIAILFSFATLSLSAVFCASAQTVEILGDGLDPSIPKEVNELLGELEPATSKFTARRQARRAAKIALDVLNSKGWLAANAEIAVEAGPPLQPLVRIDQGKRYTIKDTAIKITDDQILPADIPDLNISSGNIASAEKILNEEASLLSHLKANGYAFASKKTREVIGDRSTGTVDLTYNFTSGPKICLGNITTQNPGRTRESIITKLSPFKHGEVYSPEALSEYKNRLSQTQLYKYAKVELVATAYAPTTIEPKQQACETRDVLITLEDANRRTVTAGASYATTEGLGFQAGYEMRNYSGRADTVNIDLQLNNLEQSLSGRWKQPLNGGYRHSLTLSGAIQHEETDAFDRNAILANAIYERPWTKRIDIFAGIGAEVGEETQNGSSIDFQIISGQGGARFDSTDNALDPSQGVRLLVSAEPAYSLGDAEGQFMTTHAQARGYLGFKEDKYILAGRAKVGGILGASLTDIPSSKRFYAGGGGSVRGYEYQSIGPFDEDNTPLGGKSLLELSLEARIRLKNNFGIAAFIDAGEVGNEEIPAFADLRMGAGLGLRYYTGFGPLRLDIATPVNPREGDQNLLVYLSIGQAF